MAFANGIQMRVVGGGAIEGGLFKTTCSSFAFLPKLLRNEALSNDRCENLHRAAPSSPHESPTPEFHAESSTHHSRKQTRRANGARGKSRGPKGARRPAPPPPPAALRALAARIRGRRTPIPASSTVTCDGRRPTAATAPYATKCRSK